MTPAAQALRPAAAPLRPRAPAADSCCTQPACLRPMWRERSLAQPSPCAEASGSSFVGQAHEHAIQPLHVGGGIRKLPPFRQRGLIVKELRELRELPGIAHRVEIL